MLIRDSNDCIVTWNTGAEALYGFSRAEAMGQVPHDLLKTVFPTSREAVAEALATMGHWEGELVHTAKDGRRVVVASHQVMRRDDDGRPLGIIEINNDVTEQRQAEEALRESEGRYHTLFDTLLEGFCIIEMVFDDDGKPIDYRFLEVNPAFEQQTGLPGATGRLMRDLAPITRRTGLKSTAKPR